MDEVYSPAFWDLFGQLDDPSAVAGPDQLHELAQAYLVPGTRILDVGCRDARHLLRLVESRRAGDVSGLGIDPVSWHIERAVAAVQQAGQSEAVEVRQGVAEHITEPSGTFNLIWCRDVLEVLPDLHGALAEMARVLAMDGHVLAYTNVHRDERAAAAVAGLHAPLGNVADNLDRHRLLEVFARVGLEVLEEVVVGTDWREYLEVREATSSRDLLRLSRLRRRRAEIVATYGLQAFDTAEASLQWSVHQFLGNLVPTIWILGASKAT